MKPLSFLILAICWSKLLTRLLPLGSDDPTAKPLRLARRHVGVERVGSYSSSGLIGQNSAMREFCWLLFVAVPAIARADLPPDIERVLTAHKIPASEVSVLVEAVDADAPILSHLATESRSPASVMKTITTWSALELLGPTFVWQTEVYMLGTFDGRKLDGSLALKGYGDPYLVEEEVWKLVHALRRSG